MVEKEAYVAISTIEVVAICAKEDAVSADKVSIAGHMGIVLTLELNVKFRQISITSLKHLPT